MGYTDEAHIISDGGEIAATIYYDRGSELLSTSVNPDATVRVPAFMRMLRERGVVELDDRLTRMYLRDHTCPPGRLNIDAILANAGLDHYDLFDLFCWANADDLQGGYKVERKPSIEKDAGRGPMLRR